MEGTKDTNVMFGKESFTSMSIAFVNVEWIDHEEFIQTTTQSTGIQLRVYRVDLVDSEMADDLYVR